MPTGSASVTPDILTTAGTTGLVYMPVVLGTSAIGGSNTTIGTDRLRVFGPYTLAKSGTRATFQIYLGSDTTNAQTLRGVIYADSSSLPGALTYITSAELTVNAGDATGWRSVAASGTLAAGTYWIGFWGSTQATGAKYYYGTLTNGEYFKQTTYSSSSNPPNPIGTTTANARQGSVYLTVISDVTASASVTPAAFTSTASGTVTSAPTYTASASVTPAVFTTSASGTVVNPGYTGAASVTPGTFSATATGTYGTARTGAASVTPSAFTTTASGQAYMPVALGTATIGATNSAIGSDRLRVWGPFTLAKRGTRTAFYAYLGSDATNAQTLRAVIYTDNAGVPGALTYITSEEITVNANDTAQWRLINASGSLPAGTYWLGLWGSTQAAGAKPYYDTVATGEYFKQVTYSSTGNPSNPLGSSSTNNRVGSMYAVVIPDVTATASVTPDVFTTVASGIGNSTSVIGSASVTPQAASTTASGTFVTQIVTGNASVTPAAFTSAANAYATISTFGNDYGYGTITRTGNNRLEISGPDSPLVSGTAVRIRAWMAGGTTDQAVRAYIYNNDSSANTDKPGTLVVASSEVTIPAGQSAGWVNFPIAPTSISATTDYHFGIWYGATGNAILYQDDKIGTEYYRTSTYSSTGSPPTTYNITSATRVSRFSRICVDYAPSVAVPVATPSTHTAYAPTALAATANVLNPISGPHRWGNVSEYVPVTPADDYYTRFEWSDVETSLGVYDFSVIETALASATAAGQRFATRIRLMKANTDGSTNVPSYMTAYGWRSSTDNTFYPDWNAPYLLTRLTALFNALGAQFDGRLAWIDVGIYGQYGEWVAGAIPYGTDPNSAGYTVADPGTKQAYIDIVANAFPNTPIVVHPVDSDALQYATATYSNIGYRVDGFGNVAASEHLWGQRTPEDRAITYRAWKTKPIVAEFYGGVTDWQLATLQARRFRLSSVGNGNISGTFSGLSSTDQNRALALFRTGLGYRIGLERADLPTTIDGTAQTWYTYWRNYGVTTPKNVTWQVQYRFKSGSTVVWTYTSTLNLGNIYPTAARAYQHTETVAPPIPSGTYTVEMTVTDAAGVRQPMALAQSGGSSGVYTLGNVTVSSTANIGTASVTPGAYTTTATGTSGVIVTGNATVTPGLFTSAASGTHVAPVFTASASVTPATFTATSTGTHVAPVFTGNADLASIATTTASGTNTPPAFTASANVTTDAFTTSATGIFGVSFIASANVTPGAFTSASSGTYTLPVYAGVAALLPDAATLAASGVYTPPAVTGSAALAPAPATTTATGTNTPPAFTGNATVSPSAASTDAQGTSGAPIYTATADAVTGIASVVATATYFMPGTYVASANVTPGAFTSTAAGLVTDLPIPTGRKIALPLETRRI